jgi:hypothetical protein
MQMAVCVFSLFYPFLHAVVILEQQTVEFIFEMSLLGLLISLGLSFWEISISVNALVIAFE